eukprot:GILI01002954.1.p1 GENE.GILI01002954.1~~GILI01002954.1.p1  ORF type:complete len:758 (+),score=211.14 GILI01002954.1:172-2445(+)
MDFHAIEARDGVRFSWNVWPSSRLEATRIIVPTGCMYTPLKEIEGIPTVEYEPIRCKGQNCGSVLSPYCQIDFRGKLWTCPFCLQRNHFPPHYAENISETNLPAELIPNYTTIEYILPNTISGPPVFLFVVDTAIIDEELSEVKDSLQQVLNLLPEEAMVGLITYGKMAQVHELGFAECPKSYVFRGSKEITTQQVQDQLGLAARNAPNAPKGAASGGSRRFLLPLSECEFAFNSILDDLQRDPWPVAADHRPARCVGVALSVASSLLEATYPNQGARIILLVGGAATAGPGAIVSEELSEAIRSHPDLQKENPNTKLHKKAVKFYQSVSQRAAKNGHAIDIFCSSLDQVGLLEMKSCVDKTGGYMVMADSFGHPVFKESFKKVFARDSSGYVRMGFGATLETLCSREFKICGAIGPCSSMGKKNSPYVAETELGQGGTNAWSMGSIDKNTTLAVYFEVVNPGNTPIPQGKSGYIQFLTHYQHPSGRFRLRVTTVAHRYSENLADLAAGFDQEAAAVLIGRIAVHKTDADEPMDVLRWLDRTLIRLVAKFADYRKEDVSSFRLSREFSIYPQFMFHLRRSQFLQTFNASPDETTYYRTLMVRENTTNTLVMIQPALLQYSFEAGPPQPVLLDVASLKPNVILLLDAFFYVVVWHGETIAAWREAGYHNQPEYANFKQLLQAPKEDAKLIMDERFPAPKFVDCDQGGSQARFLMARVNPSVTHTSNMNSLGQGDGFVFTDDVSLKVFMDHLIRLAVQS